MDAHLYERLPPVELLGEAHKARSLPLPAIGRRVPGTHRIQKINSRKDMHPR